MASSRCPGINFFPFCKTELTADCLYIANHCLGCDFLHRAGLAAVNESKGKAAICNPDVRVFPLPLAHCNFCDEGLIVFCLLFLLVTCISTISLNAWSSAVWLSIRRKRPQIYFKLSLTFSDLLFGLTVLPQALFHLIDTMYVGHVEYYEFGKLVDINSNPLDYRAGWLKYFSPPSTKFSASVLYVTQGASLCSILLLTIDRHIAIARNIKYHQLMTNGLAVFLILLLWVSMAVLGAVIAFTVGKYWTITVTPSVFFLPITGAVNLELQVTTFLIYLCPLAIVFFANVFVTLFTSCALQNTLAFKPIRLSVGRKMTSMSLPTSDSELNVTSPVTTTDTCAHVPKASSIWSCSDASPTNNNGYCTRVQNPSTSRLHEAGKSSSNATLGKWKKFSTWSRPSHDNITKPFASTLNDQKRANRTLLLILLVYTVCVLPMTVLMFYHLFETDVDDFKAYDGHLVKEHGYIANMVTVGLFLTSSVWNCVIYSVRNRDYRKAARAFYKRIVAKFSNR